MAEKEEKVILPTQEELKNFNQEPVEIQEIGQIDEDSPLQLPIAERFENIENKDMQSVTVHLKNAEPVTAGNYGAFFIASRPYEVMEVRAVWSVAGSVDSTLMLERLQGTTAEGSGDNILTGTIDTTATANTVVTRANVALQNRLLDEGDRLALEDGGTLTDLSNLVVTVLLAPRGKGDYR